MEQVNKDLEAAVTRAKELAEQAFGEARMKGHMNNQSDSNEQKYTGKVLVAEDNPANQKLVEVLLERMGLTATSVVDGQQAVHATADQEFDLIIMDMQMPVMNGYEATRKLRENGLRTPIIAVTGNAMEGDEQRCLDAGCDAYLSKPLDRRKFHQTLNRYLQAEGSGGAGGQAGATGSGAQVGATDAKPSQADAGVSKSGSSDYANPRELAEQCLNGLPEQMQGVENVAQQISKGWLNELIEALKESGGSEACSALLQKAAHIEQLANSQQIEALEEQLGELSELCQKMQQQSGGQNIQ